MKAKLLHDEASRQKRVREEAEQEQQKKPSAVVTQKSAKKSKKSENGASNDSTVIYLGHIPHGFYERQMYTFFGQFGKVLKVKLFRNPKTKKSRGYAFVKFELPDVAAEVASAMNGYFLQDRKLKCEIVPLDRQHEGMFLPPKKTAVPEVYNAEDAVEGDDNDNDDDVIPPVKAITEKQRKEQEKKQQRLTALGIDYDLSAVFTKPSPKPITTKPTPKQKPDTAKPTAATEKAVTKAASKTTKAKK